MDTVTKHWLVNLTWAERLLCSLLGLTKMSYSWSMYSTSSCFYQLATITSTWECIFWFCSIPKKCNPMFLSHLRSQIYNPRVPRYHHLDHRGSPSCSNTFWTEVLWHRLNWRTTWRTWSAITFQFFFFWLYFCLVSHVLLVVPNTY